MNFATAMGKAFAGMQAVFGSVTITANTHSATCILSNVDKERVARDTGFMPMYEAIAELSRADATTLGVYPLETTGRRNLVTAGGTAFKCIGIEDDPHDPYVRLHLTKKV